MKYGTHNSLTYAKLVWWQRPFAWLINPFCRCQDKDITAQVQSDVVVFDIQIALYKDEWKVSHGIAWYDVDVIQMLKYLNRLADGLNTRFAIRIGLDRHFFRTKKKRGEERIRFDEVIDFVMVAMKNLRPLGVYVEYPEYKALEEFQQMYMEQRYWSLSFAKEKAKQTRGLWKYLYYLPIPRLWARKYRNEWEATAIQNNRKIFMTDFI